MGIKAISTIFWKNGLCDTDYHSIACKDIYYFRLQQQVSSLLEDGCTIHTAIIMN